MSEAQNFQQRWELRRGGDDLDSSSDDFKSSSGDEPVLKKHRLVSNLILPEKDEISDAPSSQHDDPLDPNKGIMSEFREVEKKQKGRGKRHHEIKKKMERGSTKKGKRLSNSQRMRGPIALDDFKTFTKSIIEDLKVAREEMFICMREEMEKFVPKELSSKPRKKKAPSVKKLGEGPCRKKVELGKRAHSRNGKPLDRSAKSNRATDSNKCHEIIEDQASPVKTIGPVSDQVSPVKTIGPVSSNEKAKAENSSVPIKEPIHSSSLSDRVVSSPYLSLPTVLSVPRSQNQIAAENKRGMDLESVKLRNDESTPRGYFPGIQNSEHFGNVSQMGFHSMGYLNQHTTQISSAGFPVGLRQGLRNGFNIPSQALENSPRRNNLLGLRVDGGAIRFSGGNYALPGPFVASNSGGK